MSLRIGIGTNLRIQGVKFPWSRYWAHSNLLLFFASDNTNILNKVVATQLPNQVTGSTDYLTVTGSGLNARYRTPDNATYRTADSDYCFWKTDASESTCDGNRLIGYDFPRILVKYLNVAPYTILWIAILNPGVTVTNQMRDSFDLSKWWDNTLSAHGAIKGNRVIGQSVWVTESVIPVAITDTTKTGAFFLPSDLTTITKDGANLVSQIRDKNGTGHDLNAIYTTLLWSADGITTDGLNNIMQGLWTYPQPAYIFLLIKPLSWVSLAAIMDGGALYGAYIRQYSVTPNIQYYMGALSAECADLVVGQWSIIRFLVKGASSKLIVNNGTPVATSESTDPLGGITLACKANFAGVAGNFILAGMVCGKVEYITQEEKDIYNYLADIKGLAHI